MGKTHAIAIDGPAGAGKSTIAKRVSARLGYIYVDTGAMFRAIALTVLRSGADPEDGESIAAAAEKADICIVYEDGAQQIMLDGENVSGLIRTEEVSRMASVVSVYPAVRKKLLELQRRIASEQNVVMDGRDIGTVVLPHADTKVFLTASPRVRALRRYNELIGRGAEADLVDIERDIIERDSRDMNRSEAPLRQAEDAYLLDSSDMTIDGVVDKILSLAGKEGKDA